MHSNGITFVFNYLQKKWKIKKMLKKIKANKIFSLLFGSQKERKATSTSLQEMLKDVPRYPPFAKGLPLASTSDLMLSQQEMLRKIELEVGIDVYKEIYEPSIIAYCELVHLLPASERDHHRGAGGLFRHGLEVAFNSLIFAKHKLFDTNLPPSERIENEPKWHLAAFLSGLSHDIGKPLSDYQVISEDGHYTWNPFTHSISSWGEEHGLEKYYLHWQKDRYRKHESLSSVVAKKIITDQALGFLSTTGNYIIRNMYECISNQPDHNNKLYELTKKADHASAEKDSMTANLRGEDVNLALPLDKYILDAIKLLNIKNDWGSDFVNSPPLIFKNGSLFLTAKAIKRLTEQLANSKVPGVPWDNKALTESLISTGFAESRVTIDGAESNMWPLLKSEENRITWAARLKDWFLIYPDMPNENAEFKVLSEQELESIGNKVSREKLEENKSDKLPKHKVEAPTGTSSIKQDSINEKHVKHQNTSNGTEDLESSEVTQKERTENLEKAQRNAKVSREKLDEEKSTLPPSPPSESNSQKSEKPSSEPATSAHALLIGELASKAKERMHRIRKGEVQIIWSRIPLSPEKKKEFLESIKSILIPNSGGSYSHTEKDASFLRIDSKWTEVIKKEIEKQGRTASKKKKPKNERPEIKTHREVPSDFEIENVSAKKTEPAKSQPNQSVEVKEVVNTTKYAGKTNVAKSQNDDNRDIEFINALQDVVNVANHSKVSALYKKAKASQIALDDFLPQLKILIKDEPLALQKLKTIMGKYG